MKKKHQSVNLWRRSIAVMLTLVIVCGLSFTSSPQRATATESTQGFLPIDTAKAEQAKALGISTSQPSRIDPITKQPIDKKNNNPFGANALMNQSYRQLALTGVSSTANSGDKNPNRVFNAPTPSGGLNLNSYLGGGTIDYTSAAEYNKPKAMVSADISGTGKETIITAYLNKGISIDKKNFKATLKNNLIFKLTSYDSTNSMSQSSYTMPEDFKTTPGQWDNYMQIYPIKAVSGDFNHDGKDDVAILIYENVAIYSFATGQPVLIAQEEIPSAFHTIDLSSGDANSDGYRDLLLSVGGATGALYIYNRINQDSDFTLAQASGSVSLSTKEEQGSIVTYKNMIFPSADVGDVFGEGEKVVIIGGKTQIKKTDSSNPKKKPVVTDSTEVCLAYIKYDGNTGKYSKVSGFYSTKTIYKGKDKGYIAEATRNNILKVKTVNLDTPALGVPVSLIVGDTIFKYNKEKSIFEQRQITETKISKSYYDPEKKNMDGLTSSEKEGNSLKLSGGNITNANLEDNKKFIMDVVVGNFDGNTQGIEQIIMLHFNEWNNHPGNAYVTVAGRKDPSNPESTTLISNLTQIGRFTSDKILKNNFYYPAICAPNTNGDGVRLEYIPERSEYSFRKPEVVAVLGAAPYYAELENQYGNLYGNIATSFGESKTTGTSVGNGVNFTAGLSFGVEQELSIFVKLAEASFEAELETNMTWMWTNSKSITKAISYTATTEDMVVAVVVPIDVYYYKVSVIKNGKSVENTQMRVEVPYEPIDKMMGVEDYNNAVKGMKDAPYIPDEVLNHTAGDPRTYLTSLSQIKNYSNIEGNETVTSGNKTSTGTGVGFATQTIGEEDTKEKNYDVSLDYKATVKAGVGGVTVGASVGYGYSRSLGWSATNAKEFSGTVVSVPKDYSQYSFEWTLLTYNYLLPKQDGTYNKEASRCVVVNYAVAPTFGDLPPRVPQNFQVDNGITVPGGVALKWDKVDGAGSYVVLKAISSNDKEPSEKDYVTVATINDTTYVVDKIDLGTSYFKVFARSFTDKKGLPTEEAIKVNAKLPINLTIMQHPKNVYIEGEKLDLSSLVASIGYEGNITQDIEYKDFTTYGLSTSGLNDGQVLSSNHNNLVITVNHNAAKLTANINPLLIDIAGLYNLSANVVFKIGEKDNATQLKANEELVAAITTRNLKSEEQKIMVIVALYDEKGTMVKMVWEGRNVPAMGMETMKLGFKLPGMINGHVVKVMLWDGNNFNSTIQSPQSGTVQLMAP